MKTVLATREGLAGHVTAPGFTVKLAGVGLLKRRGVVIDADQTPFTFDDLFVALPSGRALGRWVRVRYGTRDVTVPVLDLGPWFPFRAKFADGYGPDDAYVFGSKRPLAEVLKGQRRAGDAKQLRINGAGIDLSDGVIRAFGMSPPAWGIRHVSWEFLDPALEQARAAS